MKLRLRITHLYHRFGIRFVSLLLTNALLLSLVFLDSDNKAAARANFLSQTAPASAPPEPYIFSAAASPGILFPAINEIVTPVAESYSQIAAFLAAKTPEGLGAATPPATLTERLSSLVVPLFFASSETSNEAKERASSESVSKAPRPFACSGVAFDFDADCFADFGRWQPNSFQYKIYYSDAQEYTTLNLGSSSAKIAPADFDGDGRFDMTIFSAGAWTVRKSAKNEDWNVSWGTTGDLPYPADYDGDGIADFAIYRPSTNTFWVLTSSSNYASYTSTAFGTTGDIVVPGNFDGDNKADCAVFRPSTGYWYYLPSSGGSFVGTQWGLATDIPAPGDFDGDGKTDHTVFRPSTGMWYVLKSSGGSPNYTETSWGSLGDQPVPADYDGDGRPDKAVYRPTTGEWWVLKSSGGSPNYFVHTLGTTADVAVPSAYLKQSGAELYPNQLSPARLAPINATGDTNYYSRNSGWGAGLVSLPGRSGLNLSIDISYNSLVWTKIGSVMAFDMDHSNVSPGFNFGFPRIEPAYLSSQTSTLSYLMVLPSGGRTEFRQTAASDIYETADSSYAQIKVNNPGSANEPTPIEDMTLTLTSRDGAQLEYSWIGNAYHCTKIKDRNGNYITIGHAGDGRLTSITDTLGRVVTVNYDGYLRLSSITQNWQTNNGQSSTTTTHNWATFTYTTKTISTSFDSSLTVYGPPNNASISVLEKITLADGSYTKFDYNGYAQVYKISGYASGNGLLNYVWRNIESPSSNQTDCPRFTQTKNYVANFNGGNEVTVNNTFSTGQTYTLPDASTPTGTRIEVKTPDSTGAADALVTKVYAPSSGWAESLPVLVEDWATESSTLTKKRWAWTIYTQENTGLSYIKNPRVTETQMLDAANTKRTTIDYLMQSGSSTVTQYGLASKVKVYDGSTVLKTQTTGYNLDSNYISRRIIGLPSESKVYEGTDTSGTLVSKMTYDYDESGYSGTGQSVSATQHDAANYGTGFSYRGNQTRARRWDVTNSTTAATESLSVSSQIKYNIAGSAVSQTNPRGYTTSISYTDVWNDTVSRSATYAYPTTVTDPGGFSSTVKYRYDFGVNVWARNPTPAGSGNNNGRTTSRTYNDTTGRVTEEKVENSGAYQRYVYPNDGASLNTYTTIIDNDNDGADSDDEVLTETLFDGVGRVRKTRTENPTSTGGWTGKILEYDILGQLKRESVPTEINSSYEPAGDDAARGWLWTYKKYDWKGRITRVINTDGADSSTLNDSDQLYTYSGCGCAGGQVTTTDGEYVQVPGQSYSARRTQKVYEDALGRKYKTEIMNWDGSTVYSTTIQTYNGRDQVTNTRQYVGTTSSSTYQDVTMTYDGHGRMATRHYPVEDSNTTTSWLYNTDDSIQQITDPRGAIVNISYNSRGLIEEAAYTPPSNYPPANSPAYMNVPDTPTSTFEYDAAGNRTEMNDGLGTVTYQYNELSQLTSETRNFSDTLENAPASNNGFKIEYGYNLSGGLKNYKDPYGQQIDYTNDKTGRLTKVDGTSFGAQSTTHYADGIQYRAWGATKQLTYKTDDNALVKMLYDTRLRVSQHEVESSAWQSGYVKRATFSYLADSRVSAMDNLMYPDFDRTFAYDHLGRVTNNHFGGSSSVYTQTITYDAFSHITNRNTTYYGDNNSFTSTWTNGREQTQGVTGTLYDPAGNQINTGYRTFNLYQTSTYDAANRRVAFTSRNRRKSGRYSYITTVHGFGQEFDGDGHVLKQTRQVNSQSEPTQTKYQVWSTILKSYLTEANYTGEKLKTKVFAGSAVIAEQNRIPVYQGDDIDSVAFIHADPVTGSAQYVTETGENWYRTEYEPLGQEVNPYGNEEEFPEPQDSTYTLIAADDPQWQCQVERAIGTNFFGLPAHCQRAIIDADPTGDWRWEGETNPHGISEPPDPSSPPGDTTSPGETGTGEGDESELPVDPAPTEKPQGNEETEGTVPVSSVPSEDGDRQPPKLKPAEKLSKEELEARRALAATGIFDDEGGKRNESRNANNNILLFWDKFDVSSNMTEFKKQVVEFFETYGKKFRNCVWEIFSKDRNGNKSNVADIMETPSSKVFPYNMVTLYQAMPGAQGFHSGSTGRIGLKTTYNDSTLYDGTTVTGKEQFFRTLAHEYANYLSWFHTSDATTFGVKGGIQGDGSPGGGLRSVNVDDDTGARMEKCIWGNTSF